MWIKILDIANKFKGIIGGVMAVIGVASYIYAQGIKTANVNHEDVEFKTKTITTLDKLVKSDSIMGININGIADGQNKISKKVDDNIRSTEAVRGVLKEHILKTATKEDIVNMYDNLFAVKKNNELSSFKIPLRPED